MKRDRFRVTVREGAYDGNCSPPPSEAATALAWTGAPRREDDVAGALDDIATIGRRELREGVRGNAVGCNAVTLVASSMV